MTLWRRTRTEMEGAMRSLRYDLGRRADTTPSPVASGSVPDVTSTGMQTFGGAAGEVPAAGPVGHVRPPRLITAVAAFGTLAVAGAAGSYFAVVNGLGALLVDEPAQHGPYPLAVGGQGGAGGEDVASNAGMGRGSAQRPAPATTTPATAAATVTVPAATTAAGVPVPQATQPAPPITSAPRTVPAPTEPAPPPSEGCGECEAPPVPTPTSVPDSPTPTETASEPPSPAPTETSPEPAPDDSEPASPSEDASSPAGED